MLLNVRICWRIASSLALRTLYSLTLDRFSSFGFMRFSLIPLLSFGLLPTSLFLLPLLIFTQTSRIVQVDFRRPGFKPRRAAVLAPAHPSAPSTWLAAEKLIFVFLRLQLLDVVCEGKIYGLCGVITAVTAPMEHPRLDHHVLPRLLNNTIHIDATACEEIRRQRQVFVP